MMTTTPTTAAPASGDTLSNKTIYLAIKRGRFGNSKQASLVPFEVNADKTLLKASKQLLDSPELKAVQNLDTERTRWLESIGYSAMFKGGVYMISIPMVEAVNKELQAWKERRDALVDVAVSAYPTRIAEAMARLKVVGSITDYPTPDAFRSKFYFEWNWITMDTPTRLKAISAEIFEQEKIKAQAQLASVADECRNAMRAQMLKLVAHMRERVTPAADGKVKRFTKATITNMNEFLTLFEMRDVTDDGDLGDLVKQARAALEGVDADTLKSDELIRLKIEQTFSAIEDSLSTMVVTTGTRDISFDISFDDEGPLPTAASQDDDEELPQEALDALEMVGAGEFSDPEDIPVV